MSVQSATSHHALPSLRPAASPARARQQQTPMMTRTTQGFVRNALTSTSVMLPVPSLLRRSFDAPCRVASVPFAQMFGGNLSLTHSRQCTRKGPWPPSQFAALVVIAWETTRSSQQMQTFVMKWLKKRKKIPPSTSAVTALM